MILEQQGATKLDQEILNLALSGHLTPHPPLIKAHLFNQASRSQ